MASAFDRAIERLEAYYEAVGDEHFELVARSSERKVKGKHVKQIEAIVNEIAFVDGTEHRFPECTFSIVAKTREPVLNDLRPTLVAASFPLEFWLYDAPDIGPRTLVWQIP